MVLPALTGAENGAGMTFSSDAAGTADTSKKRRLGYDCVYRYAAFPFRSRNRWCACLDSFSD